MVHQTETPHSATLCPPLTGFNDPNPDILYMGKRHYRANHPTPRQGVEMAEESKRNWSSLDETSSLAGYVDNVLLSNGNENSGRVRLLKLPD